MKRNTFLTLLAFVFALVSCKKDHPVIYPVEGLWIGTYTVDQNPNQSPLFYSFSVKPDGTILTESKGGDGVSYYSEGTWTLTGDQFAFTIKTINVEPSPIKQSGKLTFHNSGKMTNGTWEDIENPYTKTGNKGKFSTMNRVN